MSIAALVLAAGSSRRLGRIKQLEPWGESNLLESVLRRTEEFGVEEIWVVVGYESERILAGCDLGDAGVIENPEWEEGIASSIRVGLDALTRLSRCESVMIVIGDQPDVPLELVSELLESHALTDHAVTVPKYRYSSGNPVIVDRALWPRLMSLEGDEGASRLWKAHPDWVNEVWTSELAPRDVDTESDVVDLRPKHLS
jgi:molybdenum cofactor cytidylyltransferase